MIARIFPKRTNMTPTDEHSYIGPPHYPLLIPNYDEIHISVCFTWDIPCALKLVKKWQFLSKVKMGGPAFDDCDGEFIPGRYLKRGVTITSRGCTKNCTWCLVPKREGKLREMPICDGWIVQDNNLLACSKEHIEKVFEMLKRQKKGVKFSGGLDIDYLQPWHVELLKSIKIDEIWVSCDRPEDLVRLPKARDLLADFNIEKRRCYVLIGYDGDSIYEAEKRLEAVYEAGFLTFAMRYRTTSQDWENTFIYRDRAWNLLTRKWTRPAAYRTRQKEKVCK